MQPPLKRSGACVCSSFCGGLFWGEECKNIDDEEGWEETISLGTARAVGGYVTESVRGIELEFICFEDGRAKQE
jgi:hypothetical protein